MIELRHLHQFLQLASVVGSNPAAQPVQGCEPEMLRSMDNLEPTWHSVVSP